MGECTRSCQGIVAETANEETAETIQTRKPFKAIVGTVIARASRMSTSPLTRLSAINIGFEPLKTNPRVHICYTDIDVCRYRA